MATPFDPAKFFGPTPPAPKGPPSSLLDAINPDRLDYSIPLPKDAQELWDFIKIGDISLPIKSDKPGEGFVTPWKTKIDKKAKVGAPKPRMSRIGGDAIEAKVTVVHVPEEWPAISAARKTLVPGSGPYTIEHPKATEAGMQAAMVTGWDDAPAPGSPWIIHLLQVDLAAQVGAGVGGKSPTVVSIEAELAQLEQGRAALFAALEGKSLAQDPVTAAAVEQIELRRQQLQAELVKLAAPKGEIVTPTSASGRAQAGDKVPGTGTIAGTGADAAEARRAAAREEALAGAEP